MFESRTSWPGKMPFCWGNKENRRDQEKEEAVMNNGGILLEKMIAFKEGKCCPIRNFSAEELKIATGNYDELRIIMSDAHYKLYKGFLEDRPVSVKKFKEKSFQYCFNDIVFSSRMSVHKNCLKLLGCCLETQVPVLVFEGVKDQCLADRLYCPTREDVQPLLWTPRLKIAMEIAHAVAYLHAAFSRPIVVRNIKPWNVSFDEDSVAKLSDFSFSKSIPEGESHVEDMVIGTFGYVSPKYFRTSVFNEKEDVYSFGVFLLVILTGLKAVVDSRGEESGGEERGVVHLMDHVKKYTADNQLSEIVDPIILADISSEGCCWPEIQAFTTIALSCTSESEEDRPTIIDVAKELRRLYCSAKSRS